jgi:hypothetical protein
MYIQSPRLSDGYRSSGTLIPIRLKKSQMCFGISSRFTSGGGGFRLRMTTPATGFGLAVFLAVGRCFGRFA